jgi:phosphonatase-like hydrolase
MTIELVVFDVAGTTVYDGGAVAFALQRAVGECGVRVARKDADRVMGLAKPVAISMLLGKQTSPAAVVRASEAFAHHMIEHYLRAPTVRPIDSTETMFAALHELGIKIALDTGFSRKVLDAVLLRLGWDDVVDATVASDEVPEGRPAPDMIRRAMQLTGVSDPARVAKAGDTPADMREGLAARCGLVAGVLTGTSGAEALVASGATHILASVAFMPRIVDDKAPGRRTAA